MITHDPLFIHFDESKLYIDLAAEKLIVAEEKNEQKLVLVFFVFLIVGLLIAEKLRQLEHNKKIEYIMGQLS